jgi:hypothetical protein
MVNPLGKYGAIAVIGVALLFSVIVYFAIKALKQPEKCSGDTPYTMPDGSCYQCPRKDQFNDGTKCIAVCKDPQKQCGNTCYDTGTQQCDADGNVCDELCPKKCCAKGKRCKVNAAATPSPGTTPSPSKECVVDDCNPPKVLDNKGACCDKDKYSEKDHVCCTDGNISVGHCCQKDFVWDTAQNKCSYQCGNTFCSDKESCLVYYSMNDEREGCVKQKDNRYKCSGCVTSGCDWSGLQDRRPGPAPGVSGTRLACSTDLNPTNDSVPKYCKGTAPLYASAEINAEDSTTCTRADCWQEFSSVFPESQNATPDTIAWDNGKCTAVFDTACNGLPACGDDTWCSGLSVDDTRQCCSGPGAQEGEVCPKDNQCHQTSDSTGKICQHIYDPSQCKILNKPDVADSTPRPYPAYDKEGGPADISIGYGQVELDTSDPLDYLAKNNCIGPGAFVSNNYDTYCADNGYGVNKCYGRKAIDPTKMCNTPPTTEQKINCNTMLDCIAKVNEQNCWAPYSGACVPPDDKTRGGEEDAWMTMLEGMKPEDCRGKITMASCDIDDGPGKCVFTQGFPGTDIGKNAL